MLANALKIQLDGDASSSQNILWSNTTLHQDVGAPDRTSGQYNLLTNIDGSDGAALDSGKLNAGGSHVVINKDFGNGGIRYDVQIRTRGQRVNVGGARVRTCPVGGVNSGSGDETSPGLTTKRIGVDINSRVLQGGEPITHDRGNAGIGRNGFRER